MDSPGEGARESIRSPREAVERPRARTMGGYGLLVLAGIAVVLLIREYATTMIAPAASGKAPPAAGGPVDILLHVLIALTAVIVLGQLLAKMFVRLKQPPVIGEVVAGIVLGPSLLGSGLSAMILPPEAAPYLGFIAQLGVVLYMFIVGLDLEPELLGNHAPAALATSHAGIVIPFILGFALAFPLYPRLSNGDVAMTSFALFMGVAMSITAFPVLARILTDYGISRTKLGAIALSCAAIGDVTAWCLLAFISGVARSRIGEGLFVAVGALAFVAAMFAVVRPTVKWLLRRWQGDLRIRLTVIFVTLLLSAISADAIGIHALFGAFLLGVVIPRDDDAVRAVRVRLDGVVTMLLLPAFFAFTGMRTRVDLLSTPESWVICGAIIAAATLGKFGGTFVAARLTGLGWRGAAMLGTLMNTRGLMELIVLNVGLELRIISPALFAMMVLMALATTMMTSPVLWWLKARATPVEEAEMFAAPGPESRA